LRAPLRERATRDVRQFLGPEHPPLVRVGRLIGVAFVAAGVFLRFYSPSALWLDETLSVNISRLGITQIPAALAHDGSPPLYYYLLHFWMLVFGEGNFAVRALSGVISVAALPLMWAAGRRLGGRRTAWAALLLGATSPFAIYYATATRMYSIMMLLCLLGFLAVVRLLEQPSRRRVVALVAVTAALLYTHYWGIYVVASTGAWLAFHMWRAKRRPGGNPAFDPRAVRAAFGALVVGTVCWLPCVPLFVYQTLHTGTPWTGAAGPADALGIFSAFAGTGPWALLLMFWLFALVMLGVFGRPVRLVGPRGKLTGAPAAGDADQEVPARHQVTLDLRTRPAARPLVAVVVGTLAIAVIGGALANAAFVPRYTAVVFPLFLLVAALGFTVFADRRMVAGLLGVASLAGVLTGFGNNQQQRTQAVQVAAVLNTQAQPGDEVVYCPDQLGPAVDRLLTVPDLTQLTFPRAIGPARVDWVDYKQVIDHTDVGSFAQEMLSRLPAGRTLWLVYRNGYPGFGGDCGYLDAWLNLLRPSGETVVASNSHFFEFENLVRFPD
jgi:mannosyltransferase